MTDPAADFPDRPVRIAVITKLANFNAGNEALSWCLLDFLQSRLGRAEFRLIDRTWPLSRGLNAYTAAQLREQPARVPERFEAMVDDFIRRFEGGVKRELAPVGGSANVSRPPSPSRRSRVLARLAGLLRIRSRLIAAGLLRSPEAQRAYNTLEWADVLVWNAAAEIYPTAEWDDVLRLMILFVAARRLGAQAVIVNHSMETSDPTLDRVICHVYASASLVFVRGARSLAKARSLGIAEDKLVQAPDLAFLATRATPEVGDVGAMPPGAIILAVNGKFAQRDVAGWDELVADLAHAGRPMLFLSNAMADDLAIAQRWRRRHGVHFFERQPGFREMLAIIQSAGVVVSSRLHSIIFALSTGVPVVAIEPAQHRIREVLEQIDYPVPVEDMGCAGWPGRAAASARRALSHPQPLRRFALQAVEKQESSVAKAYAPLLKLLQQGGPTPPATRAGQVQGL